MLNGGTGTIQTTSRTPVHASSLVSDRPHHNRTYFLHSVSLQPPLSCWCMREVSEVRTYTRAPEPLSLPGSQSALQRTELCLWNPPSQAAPQQSHYWWLLWLIYAEAHIQRAPPLTPHPSAWTLAQKQGSSKLLRQAFCPCFWVPPCNYLSWRQRLLSLLTVLSFAVTSWGCVVTIRWKSPSLDPPPGFCGSEPSQTYLAANGSWRCALCPLSFRKSSVSSLVPLKRRWLALPFLERLDLPEVAQNFLATFYYDLVDRHLYPRTLQSFVSSFLGSYYSQSHFKDKLYR